MSWCHQDVSLYYTSDCSLRILSILPKTFTPFVSKFRLKAARRTNDGKPMMFKSVLRPHYT